MFCQFCGKEISDNSKFCNYCGEKQEIIIPTKKICPQCKTDFDTDMSFCNECGSKLIEVPVDCASDDVKTADEPVDNEKRSFALQVDNVFTITGKGTVVTGVVTNGEIRVGDEAILSGKGDKRYCINGIECFHNLIDAATEGMSVGVLLDGAKEEFKEFDILCSVDAGNNKSDNVHEVKKAPESASATDAGGDVPVTESSFTVWVDDVFDTTGKGTVVAGIVTDGEVHTGDACILKNRPEKKYYIKGIERFSQPIDTASKGMHIGIIIDGEKAEFKKYDYLCGTAAVATVNEHVPVKESVKEPVKIPMMASSEAKVNVPDTAPQNNSDDASPLLEYRAGIYTGKGLTTFLKCVANIKFYPDRIDYESNGNVLTLAKMSDIVSVKSGMPVYTPLITKSAQIELRDGSAYTLACPKGVFDNVQTIINKYKG